MNWLKAFLSGVLATLLFHQAVVGLFWAMGLTPGPPFNMSPTPPLGVPAVFSLAFWGGLWGIPLCWFVRRWTGFHRVVGATLAGALAPTAVAMLVVFPLKGLDISVTTVAGGLLINGAWGAGVVVFMALLRARDLSSQSGS